MDRIKSRKNRPSCLNYNFEPLPSQHQSMLPTTAHNLHKDMKNAKRSAVQNGYITIQNNKSGPRNTDKIVTNLNLNEELETPAPADNNVTEYEEILAYFQKDSHVQDEGFVDCNLNTSAVPTMVDGLNGTFVLDTISLAPAEIPEPATMNKSSKMSVVAALINSSRSPKRQQKKSGGRLKNLVNLFENLTDDEAANELDETMTDWKFVNVPEAAPEKQKIIPDNQLSPWTPAYYCSVSVRPGKVRHIIDHFNRLNDSTVVEEKKEEPIYSTPIKKKVNVEAVIVPGSFEESRKNLNQFIQAARNSPEPKTSTPAPVEQQKPSKPVSRMNTMRKKCLLRIRSIVRSLSKQEDTLK